VIHTISCLGTTGPLLLDFFDDGTFRYRLSSFRINSGLIPTKRHLARRHAVHSRLVPIFTLHNPLYGHGRTLLKNVASNDIR